jgi:hypothetical protein
MSTPMSVNEEILSNNFMENRIDISTVLQHTVCIQPYIVRVLLFVTSVSCKTMAFCKKFRVYGLSPIPLRLSVVPLTNRIYEARG